MPTYEYRCKSCGNQFDAWQKMSDDPLTTCPTCGGPVRRVLLPAGIVFKGGGFYSTDHRSNGSSAAEAAATPASDGADSKPAESKPASDSKPAADTQTKASA